MGVEIIPSRDFAMLLSGLSLALLGSMALVLVGFFLLEDKRTPNKSSKMEEQKAT